jgi:hypothetical protein
MGDHDAAKRVITMRRNGWSRSREIRNDPSRDRQDPTPRLRHPVTGELVPDPAAKLEYRTILDPRETEWPPAEFIIGNPPFMGQFRQREAFGDGYVDALRAAYPQVPDAADLVIYWWYKAAKEVAEGRTMRAGFITTQSITQKQNREVIVDAEAKGARVVWAIADHYWNDGSDDARVRVAMTVIAKNPASATLVTVDGNATVVATVIVPRLNADLSAHADVSAAAGVPLRRLRTRCGRSQPGAVSALMERPGTTKGHASRRSRSRTPPPSCAPRSLLGADPSLPWNRLKSDGVHCKRHPCSRSAPPPGVKTPGSTYKVRRNGRLSRALYRANEAERQSPKGTSYCGARGFNPGLAGFTAFTGNIATLVNAGKVGSSGSRGSLPVLVTPGDRATSVGFADDDYDANLDLHPSRLWQSASTLIARQPSRAARKSG